MDTMMTYTIRLPGARTIDGRLAGRVLGELLQAVADGTAGALRLRVEGRSTTRPDRLPAWLEQGTEFTVLDFLVGAEPGVVLGAPTLGEAVPSRFEQRDMFSPIDPDKSVLSLMGESLTQAGSGNADSDAFDADLLRVMARDFARVLKRSHVEGMTVTNGSAASPVVRVDVDTLRTIGELRDRTPRTQRVRVAGHMDVIRYSTCSFLMRLAEGEQVRGVLVEADPEALRPHFGHSVVVEGMAQFRPSGRLLRIDVDQIAPATARDQLAFATLPAPLATAVGGRAHRLPQGARSGLNAIIGRWPGTETDDEVERYLRELS
jgi:hypothetical protein